MDEAWRHAALDGVVNKAQLQSIDECMQEVVVQMQAQVMPQRDDGRLGGNELEHELYGVEQGGFDAGVDEHALDLLTFHDANGSGHTPASDVLFQVLCARLLAPTQILDLTLGQVNDLPTIKKRRTEREPQWGECDSGVHQHPQQYYRHQQQLQQQQQQYQHQQPVRRSQERACDAWRGGGVEEEPIRDAGNYKHASTLRLEQRSGSSQCHLAWNVSHEQQEQAASVADIHRQMMSRSDFNDSESTAGWQERWNGGSARDNASIKGRAAWVPLQNAKERLK